MHISRGYLLSQLFVQGSREKETILVVLIMKLYLAFNNKLKNTILRRKLFAETRSMLQEKNPRMNSIIINTNPLPNLLLNWTFANMYYFYYCNKISLLQLLENSPVSSSIMIYFNIKMRSRLFNVNLSGLKCDCVSKKTTPAPFIGNFMELTWFTHVQCYLWCYQSIMIPTLLYLAQNTWNFPQLLALLELSQHIHVQTLDILTLLSLSCPHDIDFLELQYLQV